MNKQYQIFEEIEAVIFDFDGTLYDKKGFAFRLVFHHLKDIFLIRAERKARHFLKGVDFNEADQFYASFFRKMSATLNDKRKDAPFLSKWYFERYLPMLTHTLHKYYKAREGAESLFDYLSKNNIKIAIYSDYAEISERMNALGLSSSFRVPYSVYYSLFSAEEFGALKPSPRPFLEIANKIQVTPEKILVIGDREDTDGVGAKKAGMKFLCLVKNNKEGSSDLITWGELFSYVSCLSSKI